MTFDRFCRIAKFVMIPNRTYRVGKRLRAVRIERATHQQRVAGWRLATARGSRHFAQLARHEALRMF